MADDGRFGSDAYTPPLTGAAYLWVSGVTGGVAFKRSDPAPYNFQPINVYATPSYQEAFYDDSVLVSFPIHNQDSADHCYALEFNGPEGWTINTPFTFGHCVGAGQTSTPYAYVSRNLTTGTEGEIGQVSLTVKEVYEGSIVGSTSARVELFRRPAVLEFDNPWTDKPVQPGGAAVALSLFLRDDLGHLVDYSGPFSGELTATGGQISSPTSMYENGVLPLLFTPGGQTGMGTISVLAEGGLMAETSVMLAEPTGFTLALSATPTQLGSADQAALLVTVLDTQGNPAKGESVRLGVSDDTGSLGTIGGGEFIEGATDKQGKMTATFVKTPGAQGQVIVRAELLGQNEVVLREVNVVLYLSEQSPGSNVYLPMQVRGR